VAGAGDVNADGFADVIIGAPKAEAGAGSTYVVFGRAAGFPAQIDLATLDGTNGFRLDGKPGTHDDESGYSVASAGDVNGDGADDIIIAAPRYGQDGITGASYVVFGRP
jgi:hypothetical protein